MGLSLFVVVPSPSLPLLLLPQAHKVPSVLIAIVWECPAETTATLSNIITGLSLFVVVPSPSWPLLLRPQAHSVPSSLIAIV